MKSTQPLTNPEVYKTNNPNWEPWATYEEFIACIKNKIPHN